MAIPEGHYGRVAPRSGLAAKHHIDTGAGVIDSDYRGPLKVLLFNLGQDDYEGMYFIECLMLDWMLIALFIF